MNCKCGEPMREIYNEVSCFDSARPLPRSKGADRMKKKNPTVIRVTQSPMNAKRWCLELSCGHELWVTSGARPTGKTKRCPTCIAGAARKELSDG